VPCPSRLCRFRVPLDNGELQIFALNDKPVNRIAGNCSADFTPEFLYRCHKFPIVEPGASLRLIIADCFDLKKETDCNAVQFGRVLGVCHTGLTTFTRSLAIFQVETPQSARSIRRTIGGTIRARKRGFPGGIASRCVFLDERMVPRRTMNRRSCWKRDMEVFSSAESHLIPIPGVLDERMRSRSILRPRRTQHV